MTILNVGLRACLLLLLAGCAKPYVITGIDNTRLAQCYQGAFTGFCVVNVTKDQIVVGQQGLVQGIGGVMGTLNNTAVSSAILSAVP